MIARVLVARALRAFADGFIAVVLPAYLLALGLGQFEVGLIGTATPFGSALTVVMMGFLSIWMIGYLRSAAREARNPVAA